MSGVTNGEPGIPPRPLFPPPAARPPKRRWSRTATLSVVAATLVVLGVLAIIVVKLLTMQQLTADYTALARDYNEQVAEFADVDEALVGTTDELANTSEYLASFLEAAAPGYVNPDSREQLVERLESLDEALANNDIDSTTTFDTVARQPADGVDETELRDEIDSVTELSESIQVAIDEREEASTALITAGDDVESSTEAVIASVAPVSGELLEAAPSASNGSRMDLEQAVSALTPSTQWQLQSTLDAMSDYVSAMQSVQQSHTSREAAKAQPDYANRMLIEEFARSISGGVVLDLDWAPVVNGFGPGGTPGYGGTAQWWYAKPNYTLITLSENVATDWNSPQSVRDLVAHEVGHAISIKPSCTVAFNSAPINGDAEAWATAWAIGMGFTGPGNGTWAYGAPTQEQIDATMSCR